MPIDSNLLEAMREGRVVLFLGAGASRGATSLTGEKIPDGKELGVQLSNKFLQGKYATDPFKIIYDYSCSRKSVPEVQEFLHAELNKYAPAPFHLQLPEFMWGGIATTNYDLVVERAYRQAGKNALQHLQPYRSDDDVPAAGFNPDDLQYVKLHGCITEYKKVTPPLVGSTEQIVEYRDGRAAQFQQFLEWAQTRVIVFAGYRLDDDNLRTLLTRIIKLGDKRPRHYIVRPGGDEIEANYWEDRRFKVLSLTFEQFLAELSSAIPPATRRLAKVGALLTKSAFSRRISVPGASESDALLRYLSTECEYVSTETVATASDPQRFYAGFDVGWYAVDADLDVRRRVGETILADQVVARADTAKPTFIVLKAHAGAGKSVILRRIAWDAARVHDRVVFFVGRAGRIDVERFEEVFSLTNKGVFLIVDSAAQHLDQLTELLARARKRKWPLAVVSSERINEWNISCEELDDEVDAEYVLQYLLKHEIDDLLFKLELHDSLGFLKSIPAPERPQYLTAQYGRQLLVALHEATKNANFSDIVDNEYKGIEPPEARLLYLDICALNRFGSPVRAGLIARVHGIDFDEFKFRFFDPLEQVVEAKRDARTGDWTYQARHPLIADMVYRSSLHSVDDRFDNIMRIVSKLNPTYSYDQDVLYHLVRASTLNELFLDRVRGIAVYQSAMETFGRTYGLLHQRGIYEMRRAGDAGGLDRAQQLFEEALAVSPGNPAIRHSLAELALQRARVGKSPAEREVWRREATSQARALANGNSSFPFHTMAKSAVDEVQDRLERYEAQPDNLTELALDEAIKVAEETIRKALQRFPNDDRLLATEAELAKILNNAERALAALQRAFKNNPRSSLVARRLALILRAKTDLPAAISILTVALGHNAGNEELHYLVATCLREIAPDADQTNSDAILYHYTRSYRPGDRNYEARFWCARQHWVKSDYAAARALFDELAAVRLPYHLKVAEKGPITDHQGQLVRFNGQITTAGAGYGFLKVDGMNTTIFFYKPSGDKSGPRRDERVHFTIAFNLRGPVALDIQTLLI